MYIAKNATELKSYWKKCTAPGQWWWHSTQGNTEAADKHCEWPNLFSTWNLLIYIDASHVQSIKRLYCPQTW